MYTCKDTVTQEIVEQGAFNDYVFAPFTHPADTSHWGAHYFNNMNCTYSLTAPTGHYIFIEFILFLLDADDCAGDYVKLYLDGSTVRTICGQPTGYIYDIFEQSTATIIFISDNAVRYRGFSGYFAAYNPSECV